MPGRDYPPRYLEVAFSDARGYMRETKSDEAAAHLLRLRGGRMSYLKLIKLLYLADREALLRWGRPISTDRYVSMDRGPVLSRVLDLATDGEDPGTPSIWALSLTAPGQLRGGTQVGSWR